MISYRQPDRFVKTSTTLGQELALREKTLAFKPEFPSQAREPTGVGREE
jgi:hypothetical protein